MSNDGDWSSVVEAQFGSVYNLADSIAQYNEFDDNKKWLYFIALSIFGVKKNAYLQHAVFNSANYREFPKSLFRAILTVDHTDAEFTKLYSERKEILKGFVDSLEAFQHLIETGEATTGAIDPRKVKDFCENTSKQKIVWNRDLFV